LDAATWNLVNKAMPVFLGAGDMSPKECPERLVEQFGEKSAAELRPILEAIVQELFAITWNGQTLSSGTDFAIAQVRALYPQLSEASLEELGRLYSFCWR
jgi:hypothetical protein